MNFQRFFNLVSYSVVASGALSLWVTGGIGVVSAVVFALCAAFAWAQDKEGGRQLSEKLGTFLVVLALPFAYFGWRAGFLGGGAGDSALAGLLGQLILLLSIIKLLQKKADRDWVFLYLMAFFEVLLAAGITISPLYLLSLITFLLAIVCAVIVFEMRRSAAKAGRELSTNSDNPLGRLPGASTLIAILIITLATPMFFFLPRVGGAGFLSSPDGLATRTGFSDSVRLGEIGRLQHNNQIVMRVRVENPPDGVPLRWRGVALDLFDNRNWRSSRPYTDPPYAKLESDYFLLNFASGKSPLVTQTVYLEPLDTPVLFALGRPVAVSGGFELVFKNSDDNLKFPRRAFERIVYKVGSDPYLPPAEKLRADRNAYSVTMGRYLQLPEDVDPRIGALAADVIGRAGTTNRYDKAVAVEKFLKNNFRYTLEMKAEGAQPVADFLFNVREGHCEYFASAMALMLRSQGIATRVVNGFQQGEYNETADVYVVRQKDAHSWVEVFFPVENVWVPFDPTPSSGSENGAERGLMGGVTKYLEALETFWIQYFVAYDNQEQKSVFRSMKSSANQYQSRLSEAKDSIEDRFGRWWKRLSGEEGFGEALSAFGSLLLAPLALVLVYLGLRRFGPRMLTSPLIGKLMAWFKRKDRRQMVEFYERMQLVLERNGIVRKISQTPMEFAISLEMPEAVSITEKYNAVRFGACSLSHEERNDIELWLRRLESINRHA